MALVSFKAFKSESFAQTEHEHDAGTENTLFNLTLSSHNNGTVISRTLPTEQQLHCLFCNKVTRKFDKKIEN